MQIDFNELFYYCPESPTFLRWKIETYYKGSDSIKIVKGSVAGTLKGARGVPHVKWKGMNYKCHRVVWVVSGNTLEQGCVIDHIDGNVLNNSIENLRQVTQIINGRNCKRSKNNKSGFNGVYYSKRLNKWIASGSYTENSKNLTKHLGCFIDIEDAKIARLNWEQEIGGFSERHGK